MSDTFFSNDCSVLVSNEDEKGAPALVVSDTFFSNDCSVLVSNEDEKDTFFRNDYSVLAMKMRKALQHRKC